MTCNILNVLPIFFREKVSNICEEDIEPVTVDPLPLLLDDMVELVSNGKPAMFTSCLQPCVSTKIKFEVLADGTIDLPVSILRFNLQDQEGYQ